MIFHRPTSVNLGNGENTVVIDSFTFGLDTGFSKSGGTFNLTTSAWADLIDILNTVFIGNVTINTGGSDDELNIAVFDSFEPTAFDRPVMINRGAGDDTITLGGQDVDDPFNAVQFLARVVFNGGAISASTRFLVYWRHHTRRDSMMVVAGAHGRGDAQPSRSSLVRSLFVASMIAFAASPWSAARADDDAVKHLLNRAINGQGKAEQAASMKNLALKGKALITENGNTAEVTFDLSLRDLNLLRGELTMTIGGNMQQATIVMNGEQAWARDAAMNRAEEAPKEAFIGLQAFLIAMRGAAGPTLLAEAKDITLTHGGEAQVGDTTADLLRIVRKDRPDVVIYYDRKTGRPLKAIPVSHRPKEPTNCRLSSTSATFAKLPA